MFHTLFFFFNQHLKGKWLPRTAVNLGVWSWLRSNIHEAQPKALGLSLWPAHHWILILIILVMCAQLSKFLVGALINVRSAFPRASRRHNVRRHSQKSLDEQLWHGRWLGCGHHGGGGAGSGLQHCASIYSCLSISENLLSCVSRKKVWSSVFLDGVLFILLADPFLWPARDLSSSLEVCMKV